MEHTDTDKDEDKAEGRPQRSTSAPPPDTSRETTSINHFLNGEGGSLRLYEFSEEILKKTMESLASIFFPFCLFYYLNKKHP